MYPTEQPGELAMCIIGGIIVGGLFVGIAGWVILTIISHVISIWMEREAKKPEEQQ